MNFGTSREIKTNSFIRFYWLPFEIFDIRIKHLMRSKMRWKCRQVCGRLLKIFYFYMTIFWLEKKKKKEIRIGEKETSHEKKSFFAIHSVLKKKKIWKIRRTREEDKKKKLNEEWNEKNHNLICRSALIPLCLL